MLNLTIAMLRLLLILSFLFQDAPLAVTRPLPGETLRGLVEIQGRMDVPNFVSAEIAFTFDADASNPAANWFLIQTFPQPILDSELAAWDTTALTDGDYALRLRVNLPDGAVQDVLVTGLKVRNEVAIPTDTPIPTPTIMPDFNFQPLNETPEARMEPTATLVISRPTSTPLPPNPASLSTASILRMFWISALAAVVVFAFFALVLRIRRNN